MVFRTWPMLMKEHAISFAKENILKAVAEIHEDFAKLERYSRLNEEAIHRIYSKIERSNGLLGTFHQMHKSSWKKSQAHRRTQRAKYLEGLDDLMSSIFRATADGNIHTAARKLCPETFCDNNTIPPDPSVLSCAIKDDEPSTLADAINVSSHGATTSFFEFSLRCLAELSLVWRFERCARYLLSEVFPNHGIVMDHQFLNGLIVTTGRNTLSKRHEIPTKNTHCGFGNSDDSRYAFLTYAVDLLAHAPQNVLRAEDELRRLPLHYAAQYGLTTICESIHRHSQESPNGSFPPLALSMDCRGCTPLHYAVIGNHVETAKELLSTIMLSNQQNGLVQDQEVLSQLGHLLIIAIRYQFDEMVLLLQSYYGITCRISLPKETPLYVAVQLGREDYVKGMMENGMSSDIDVPEPLRGWTPLFIACVEGHQAVAKLLLQAGANQDLRDHRGWSVKEHAVFRGYIALAEMLHPWDNTQLIGGPACVPSKPHLSRTSHTSSVRMDFNKVIVNLGILHNRKKVQAVDLKGYISEKDLLTSDALTMEISISGDLKASHVVELPILSDMVNEPFILPMTEPSRSFLTFKIFRACNTAESESHQLVGSGATLLGDSLEGVGLHRESLVRERTVPILNQENLDIMGTVTFTFIIAQPLRMLPSQPTVGPSIAKDRLHLVGHRGTCTPRPI